MQFAAYVENFIEGQRRLVSRYPLNPSKIVDQFNP